MESYTADVKWALSALRANSEKYSLYARYYEGEHELAFASEKFRNHFGRLFQEFGINHCAVCVDVPSDDLQIDAAAPFLGATGNAATLSVEIWRRNRMKKRAGEVHTEALKTGDSFVVVDWANPDDPSKDRATIYPNMAGRCAVKYDDENPGYVIKAARWWAVSENGKVRIRLNIYFKDRIEKYTTKPRSESALPVGEAEFEPIAEDNIVPNKYGKVPVFHFANNAEIGSPGRSELKDVVPPQNGINKVSSDAMVGAEYTALGQRYVSGIEAEVDENGNPKAPFKDGLAHLWVVPPQKDEDGKTTPASDAPPIQFGQFSPANIDQLLSLKAALRQDVSLVSGIPSHYFMDAKGGWPSGEALKTANRRLDKKVADRRIAFGMVWEDVMRFCLEIEGEADAQLETNWIVEEAATVTEGANTNVD